MMALTYFRNFFLILLWLHSFRETESDLRVLMPVVIVFWVSLLLVLIREPWRLPIYGKEIPSFSAGEGV